MTRVITLMSPDSIGFDLFGAWPYEDQSVASVSVESIIMATLPHGNVWEEGNVDPLVHLFKEAERVLVDNGTLEIKAPFLGGHVGIGHPLQTRVYSEMTWAVFGCPEQRTSTKTVVNEETGEAESRDEAVDLDPKDFGWGAWLGVDFGVRFQIMHHEHDDTNWTVFYRKIPRSDLDDLNRALGNV